jgi:hypothetical protein
MAADSPQKSFETDAKACQKRSHGGSEERRAQARVRPAAAPRRVGDIGAPRLRGERLPTA